MDGRSEFPEVILFDIEVHHILEEGAWIGVGRRS